MEGGDPTANGLPTDTLRRRQKCGLSGAELIWGGEAVAVLPEGRANPNRLCVPALGRGGFATLVATVREAYRVQYGFNDNYVVAARDAEAGGFDIVDLKACHGYLVHEFLSARR